MIVQSSVSVRADLTLVLFENGMRQVAHLLRGCQMLACYHVTSGPCTLELFPHFVWDFRGSSSWRQEF